MTESNQRALVVIPTYDEIDNLESILSRTRAANPRVDILVVDDASPDGTGELADRLAAADEQIHVLHRADKNGLGRAYLAGFEWGLSRRYDVIAEMDADGSHAPEQLPDLLRALAEADLVIGSRYVAGGRVEGWAAWRLALSRGGNRYARTMLRLPVQDATAGFRAFRASVLSDLPLADISSAGYCFQVDLTWRTWRAGYDIIEVPICFTERVRGRSKMSSSIVGEALVRVGWWGLHNRSRGARALAIANRKERS
ncbi:MAG: polyprenol monophosphomannose synthase [Actinomycetota bacterium]|nr:polyprenol monophosphomannose synthase [Actinomycetota bacterium]